MTRWITALVALLATGCATVASTSEYPFDFLVLPRTAHLRIEDQSGAVHYDGAADQAGSLALSTVTSAFEHAVYTISVAAPGHESESITVETMWDPWELGNILVPIVGFIVDESTGANRRFDDYQRRQFIQLRPLDAEATR